jgi:hypothetical protein
MGPFLVILKLSLESGDLLWFHEDKTLTALKINRKLQYFQLTFNEIAVFS